MAIASKAATANKLSDPYVIATSIGKAPYYNQTISIYQSKDSTNTSSIELKLHDQNTAGLISPYSQKIYGVKTFMNSINIGDYDQNYYISLVEHPDVNYYSKARLPHDLILARTKHNGGTAYIRNRSFEDFTYTSKSGSTTYTCYRMKEDGVTLLLGSCYIRDKINSDGTTSVVNGIFYSGFKYPSFNSTTHKYTGYDINFYLPIVNTLDLTQTLTYYFLTSADWEITKSNRLMYTTSTEYGGKGTTSSHYCNNTQLGVNTATVDNYNFVVAGGSKFSGEVYVDGNKVIISDTYYPTFELRAKVANGASTYSSAQFECNYTDKAGIWIWSDYTDSTKSRRGLVLYGYKSGKDSNNCVALRQCDTEGTWLNDLYLLHSGNYANYALPLTGGTISGPINMSGSINFDNVEAGSQSAGLYWTGSTDYAKIFYYVPNADEGHLVLDIGDDDNASVIFCRNGTTTTEYAFGKTWFDVLSADTHLYKGFYVEGTSEFRSSATIKGSLYINHILDTSSNTNTGSLIIGDKDGLNIAFDNNEIMARNASTASTLYINNDGGLTRFGSGGIYVEGAASITGAISAATYVKKNNYAGTLTQSETGAGLLCTKISEYTGIYCGNADSDAQNVGTSGTANLFIKSWYGVGFVDAGTGRGMTVGVNCRTGDIASLGRIQSKAHFETTAQNQSWISATHEGRFRTTTKPIANSACSALSVQSTNGSWGIGVLHPNDNLYFMYGTDTNYNAGSNTSTNIVFGNGGQVYGAVWNDYAEYRQASTKEPGRCVVEKGDDTLELSTARLLPGANIVSDTFGFAIGETKDCTTPIAVSGRVLAYPYEPRDQFKAGDAVCSGPNGTVSIMTREEIRKYPERIIGTVSSIPTYKKWGTGDVLVDGRVWIKV